MPYNKEKIIEVKDKNNLEDEKLKDFLSLLIADNLDHKEIIKQVQLLGKTQINWLYKFLYKSNEVDNTTISYLPDSIDLYILSLGHFSESKMMHDIDHAYDDIDHAQTIDNVKKYLLNIENQKHTVDSYGERQEHYEAIQNVLVRILFALTDNESHDGLELPEDLNMEYLKSSVLLFRKLPLLFGARLSRTNNPEERNEVFNNFIIQVIGMKKEILACKNIDGKTEKARELSERIDGLIKKSIEDDGVSVSTSSTSFDSKDDSVKPGFKGSRDPAGGGDHIPATGSIASVEDETIIDDDSPDSSPTGPFEVENVISTGLEGNTTSDVSIIAKAKGGVYTGDDYKTSGYKTEANKRGMSVGFANKEDIDDSKIATAMGGGAEDVNSAIKTIIIQKQAEVIKSAVVDLFNYYQNTLGLGEGMNISDFEQLVKPIIPNIVWSAQFCGGFNSENPSDFYYGLNDGEPFQCAKSGEIEWGENGIGEVKERGVDRKNKIFKTGRAMFCNLYEENHKGLKDIADSLGIENVEDLSKLGGFFSQFFQERADEKGVLSGRMKGDNGAGIAKKRVGARITNLPREAVEEYVNGGSDESLGR